MVDTIAERIISFYKSLNPPEELPDEIQWLYPQQSAEVMSIVVDFFHKYYSDINERVLIFGINPGRFGAGTTGINFTAPRQLSKFCGIDHAFKDQSELSAEFIYEMISAYGGVEKFYSEFFVTSVCPLGFVKNGLNLNYYDDAALLKTIWSFIVSSIRAQLELGVRRKLAFCIGEGTNYKFLTGLNNQEKFFESLLPLPHPRFIMQYKRKHKEKYIELYLRNLRLA